MNYYQNYGTVNILGGPATSTASGQYRLLEPHFLNNQYVNNQWRDVDDILTEGIDIPFGWVPTLAVDPLNSTAAAAFWLAGPRDLVTAPSEDLTIYNNLYRSPHRIITYWVKLPVTLVNKALYVNTGFINILPGITFISNPPNTWVLTGLGATFGPRSL